jgi:thioredoxin reductase (NADPH)
MAMSDVQVVAFPTLDDAQSAILVAYGTRRSLHDGEFLFKAGDREFKFFVVERGAV